MKIRLTGETDVEYEQRANPPWLAMGLYKPEIAKIAKNNSVLLNHLKIMRLRESCGVKDESKLEWTVTGDINGIV